MKGIATMDDPQLTQPTTIAGMIGAAVVAVIAGGAWVAKFFSKDAVDRSANSAQVEVITILREQVAAERDRADNAEKALDETLAKMSELRAQVFDLTEQVRRLQTQVSALAPRQ